MGRWSTPDQFNTPIADTDFTSQQQFEQSVSFASVESQRVLFNQVSSHLEMTTTPLWQARPQGTILVKVFGTYAGVPEFEGGLSPRVAWRRRDPRALHTSMVEEIEQ